MNLTQLEYDNAIRQHADFIKQCDEYKSILASNGLPISVNIPLLKTTLKTILFDRLLSVDKGLRMRYDMVRSDSGKLALINSTIDLDGYDIIPELETRIKALLRSYNQIYLQFSLSQCLPFDTFATHHNLDLQKILFSYIIDWSKTEPILELFADLIPVLTKLRSLFQNTYSTHYTLELTLHRLSNFYSETNHEQPINVSEHDCLFVVQKLESIGMLADFNKRL